MDCWAGHASPRLRCDRLCRTESSGNLGDRHHGIGVAAGRRALPSRTTLAGLRWRLLGPAGRDPGLPFALLSRSVPAYSCTPRRDTPSCRAPTLSSRTRRTRLAHSTPFLALRSTTRVSCAPQLLSEGMTPLLAQRSTRGWGRDRSSLASLQRCPKWCGRGSDSQTVSLSATARASRPSDSIRETSTLRFSPTFSKRPWARTSGSARTAARWRS
jgi:hypothetical protein